MDIGDAEFTDLTNYRFTIDAVPEWSGGSTAIPTDRVLRAVPDADAAVWWGRGWSTGTSTV